MTTMQMFANDPATQSDSPDRIMAALFRSAREGKTPIYTPFLGAVSASPGFAETESSETILPDTGIIVLTEADIREQIARYERLYQISSAEFLRRVREGTAPDTFDATVWESLLQYL